MGFYIVYLLYLNKLVVNTLFIILLLLLFNATMSKLWFASFVLYSVYSKLKYLVFINLFLYGFFKIHIVMFYIFLMIGFTLLYQNSSVYLKMRYSVVVLYLVLAFSLGSLWSLYLFNWGYYWTNDSIEYILILFILLFIITMHKTFKNTTFIFLIPFILISLLWAIRSNLVYTKHNFFQSTTLIYLHIKFVWVIIIQYIIFKYISSKFCFKSTQTHTYVFIMFFLSILTNTINYFMVKNILYNIYFILFVLCFLKIEWSKIHHLYTHIALFVVYTSFILIKVCYVFYYSKLSLLLNDLSIKINNIYFLSNYNWFQNLTYIKTYSTDILFTKKQSTVTSGLSNVFVPNKNLVNYLI
jgi:hypothetical protein